MLFSINTSATIDAEDKEDALIQLSNFFNVFVSGEDYSTLLRSVSINIEPVNLVPLDIII